jgi:hypothetical protein
MTYKRICDFCGTGLIDVKKQCTVLRHTKKYLWGLFVLKIRCKNFKEPDIIRKFPDDDDQDYYSNLEHQS